MLCGQVCPRENDMTEAELREELTRICDPGTCEPEVPCISSGLSEELIERALDLHVLRALARFDECRHFHRPITLLKYQAEATLRAALLASSLRYGSSEKILDIVLDSLAGRVSEIMEDGDGILPCHHAEELRGGSLQEMFSMYARVLLDDCGTRYRRVLQEDLAREMFLISLALKEDIAERDRKACSRSEADNLVTPLPL